MSDKPSYFGWDEIGFVSSKEDIEYFKNLMESVSPAIDFTLEYCKDARWDVVYRAMDILKQKYKEEENELPLL